MKISIIGAGHIGSTLTCRLRALGHEVQVASARSTSGIDRRLPLFGGHHCTLYERVQEAGYRYGSPSE